MTTLVTADNFIRAESDRYFATLVAEGAWDVFRHDRAPAAIDKQTVVRLNRDTVYSSIVVDLDAGPISVTMPDAGDRFMSLIATKTTTPASSTAAANTPSPVGKSVPGTCC